MRTKLLSVGLLVSLILVQRVMFGAELTFDVKIDSLTAHNTSASPNYDQAHFPQNFGTTSYVSKTETIDIDPGKVDRSMNAASPGRMSGMNVHTLVPSRPDLRWFVHVMPWWGAADQPFDIGLDCDTVDYVKSMVTDLRNRGFDGAIICWNGRDSRSNGIAQKMQTYLKTLPAGSFTFMLLLDEGLVNHLPAAERQKALEDAVNYCKEKYFADPNYERENGEPLLLFYGVRGSLGSAEAMASVKSAAGGGMVWADVSTNYINEAWQDQCFDWIPVNKPVDPADPYDLTSLRNYLSIVSKSEKKAIGAMAHGFNGTLTKTAKWSLGKYLPNGDGACLIQRAQTINQNIPSNVTRMQWVTWNDWAEGTAIEAGVENDVTVTATVDRSTVSWKVTSGTGDESTIDHYEIYATADGVNAAKLGSVPPGTHSYNLVSTSGLAPGTSYQIMVVAVGRPCIRNHASAMVKFDAPTN
jgi:hypothetical protein